MNEKLFEFYEKQIENFEKISYSEAKKILKDAYKKDKTISKEIIDSVFKGTLHLVLRFVKTSNFAMLQSGSYDLEDIINTSYQLWYENIASYKILDTEDINRDLGIKFANDMTNRLIGSNQEIEYLNCIINREHFNIIIEIYFKLRNNNVEIDIDDFFAQLEESGIGEVYSLKYERYCINPIIELNIELLEKCYLILSKNDTEEVKVNKQIVQKTSKLIEKIMIFETLSKEQEAKCNVEEIIVNKLQAKYIRDTIFNSDYLSDKEKDILIRKFGLYGLERETFDEISKSYNSNGSTIAKLARNSLEKIKLTKSKKLKDSLIK